MQVRLEEYYGAMDNESVEHYSMALSLCARQIKVRDPESCT